MSIRTLLFLAFACIMAAHGRADVLLNEVVASNGAVNLDEDGSAEDWVEIHNAGPDPVALEGWGLSDSPSNPFRWVFPARTLPPGGFLLVWASGKNRATAGETPLHTNFSIDADGEDLVLTRPDGTGADALAVPPLPRDCSVGRSPVGGGWVYFLAPSPAAANAGTAYAAPLAPVTFSHARGLYQSAFQLALSHPDPAAEIYYTTNGSAPSAANGSLYAGSIPVTTTAVIRAVAVKAGTLPVAKIGTHSFLFPADVIQQSNNPAAVGFPATWGSWPFVRYGMDPAVTGDPAYAPRMLEAMTSIPSLSLVLKRDDLFHPSTGLYANRWQEGVLWERPVSMEMIYPDGSATSFQVDAGLRVQGAASRAEENTPKSSFRLLFKGEYGPTTLEVPFFKGGGSSLASINTIVLRAEWNNSWLYPNAFVYGENQRVRGLNMRDRFIRDLQIAMSGHGAHSEHVHLYLNGVYWGLYNPSERPDAAFGAAYFGGEDTDWDAITHDILNSGGVDNGIRDGDRVAYDAMMAIVDSGLASPANYAALQQYLDLPQFIDYMLLQLWVANNDWPHNNWVGIRRRAAGEGFKFFIWDSEQSMEGVQEDRLAFGINYGPGKIFQALRANPEFRLKFADHVHRHCFNDGVLTPARLVPRFVEATDRVEAAVIAESARWGSYYLENFTGTDFFQRFDWTATWPHDFTRYTRNAHWVPERDRILGQYLPARTGVVLNQFRQTFYGLYPQTVAPAFSPHGGFFPAPANVTMTAPAGVIYYTVDGSDPREAGTGAVGASAQIYTGPVQISEDRTLRARVLHNGQWSALNEADYRVPPIVPHELSGGPYSFGAWDPLAAPASYPAHMIFRQTPQADPALADPMDGTWTLPYNLGSRSRIRGLGQDGVSFINTGNAQEDPTAGFVGAAVLALDTRGRTDVRVRWTAGTVTPNARTYGLRLQYRVGSDGPFIDVTDALGAPQEYVRNPAAGHSSVLGPVRLPAAAEDQPYVELRWKYHFLEGTSGARAELRLDEVFVFAAERYEDWRARTFPDPADAADPLVSGPLADPGRTGVTNLERHAYALESGAGAADRWPSVAQGPTGPQLLFWPAPLVGDVAYVVEASPDLADWSTVLFDSRVQPLSMDAQGRCAIALSPFGGEAGRQFARVRVILLPE